ncbi:hypothetical protein RHMOL_Rhmol11G0014300 [Rhododendron molle]|uniref:Uncharacterized protein n=1 Tax=Rhododendron molle TaxID=49168 RepID=A0ACC0LN22_RHOML|nr:hypothetical protein RHMOL_RhmolUnG0005400 [Rhododendron molle]KAI8529936.1 hypothetical protein RHMOL_Rhmol11G0014300 [Rhododendron molle]
MERAHRGGAQPPLRRLQERHRRPPRLLAHHFLHRSEGGVPRQRRPCCRLQLSLICKLLDSKLIPFATSGDSRNHSCLCKLFSSLSKDNGNWNPHALGNGERNGVDTIE